MNDKPQHISDAKAVDTELAKDQFEALQDALYVAAADLTGFRPRDIIANAETKTVMDLLVGTGVCTAEQYYNTFSANLYESMEELAEQGFIDISALNLEQENGDAE